LKGFVVYTFKSEVVGLPTEVAYVGRTERHEGSSITEWYASRYVVARNAFAHDGGMGGRHMGSVIEP
jgi:hypothetical protein